jgi:hypothetical protein
MVQAIDPAMIEVSKTFKSKVLFCVIDTGLDITNFEFSGKNCRMVWCWCHGHEILNASCMVLWQVLQAARQQELGCHKASIPAQCQF